MEVAPGKYQHFKGKIYVVTGVGKHTETGEEFVIYSAEGAEENFWIRPKEMFLGKVIFEGKEVQRFRRIE